MKYRNNSIKNTNLLTQHLTEITTRHSFESREVILIPAFIQSIGGDWTTVTVVCNDSWAINKLRQFLVRCGDIRLRILNELPENELWGDLDAMIWMREQPDNLPALASEVFTLHRRCPNVRHLIINDFLPPGLTRLQGSPFPNIILARAKDDNDVLRRKIVELVSARPKTTYLLRDILNPGQWQVLFLMASGADIREIAALTATPIKTVVTQRSQAMLLLGIRNRIELSFVLRCIWQIQKEIPAFSRLMWEPRG